MDNQDWSSGTDSSESIPPVPAPRYKRKSTTYEDVKQTSNKLTGENVEANIIPPPRRKNKTKVTYETQDAYLCSEDQICSTVLDKICINNKIDTYSDTFTIGNDNKMCTDKLIQIQDMLGHHVETLPIDQFQKQDVLGHVETPVKSVFNNIASYLPEDSFLSLPTLKNILENRVNSNLSENSAMVVGMILKPEFTPKKHETCEFILNQAINNQVGIMVDNCSNSISKEYKPSPTKSAFTSGKADENTGIGTEENENSVKDVEENDSGVYFSDIIKSPLHKGITLEKETKFYNLPDHISRNRSILNETENDTRFDETFSSNNSDNIDNKHIDNMVSENYSEVLNCFEAETVSSFHMEISSRFSLCKEEISKDSIVEGSLNDEVYLTRKCYNGLSAYLRSMLETDSSIHSVSPCPVSAADDEHYRPDCCLGAFKKEPPLIDSRDVTDLKCETYPVCTVVSRDSNDLRQVVDSNEDFVVGINNVHMQHVNSYSHFENENTFLNGNYNVYSINNSDKSSKDMDNTYQKKSFVDELIENHSGNVLIANNILNNEQSVIADDEISSDLIIMSNSCITKTCDSLSPIREYGSVSTLVAFFETVHTQDIVSNYYGSDSKFGKVSDSSSLTSPENIEEVHSAKLTTQTSSGFNECPEPINDYNNVRVNESDLEDPLLNVNESFKNEPEKLFEVSSSKSTSPTCINLYEYTSYTVGQKNVITNKQAHGFYLNESIQNNPNIIPDQTLGNPPNHHFNFAYRNTENINLRKNIDFTVLEGTSSKFELDKFSIDVTEISQNAVNGVMNDATSMVLDENDTRTDISSGVEHLIKNDSDVVFDTNNINGLEENVFIVTQGGNGNSHDTSFFPNAISLNPNIAFTTSKITILNNEDMAEPTNKYLNNLTILDLSDAIRPTKVPFVPSNTGSAYSPIGLIEFNSLEDRAMEKNNSDVDDSSLTDYDCEVVGPRPKKREILMNCGSSNKDEFINTYGIILEKNWGSLGITLKGDEEGVLVNDVLAGGSSDLSGLVYEAKGKHYNARVYPK